MGTHQAGSFEITKAWLELETLMRNKTLMAAAGEALRKFGYDEDSDMEEQEVWDANGKVLGVVVRNRVRGGCASAGCSMFQGRGPVCSGCGRADADHEDKGAVEQWDVSDGE